MSSETYDHLVKVLLIGESGVGKTCVLQKFNKGEFSDKHLATIAIDFKIKYFEVNGTKLKMQIWDTAGQEKFNTLTSGFFKCLIISCARNHGGIFDYRRTILSQCHEVAQSDSPVRP